MTERKRKTEFERWFEKHRDNLLAAKIGSGLRYELESAFNAGRRAERKAANQWNLETLAKSKLPSIAELLDAERKKIRAKGRK